MVSFSFLGKTSLITIRHGHGREVMMSCVTGVASQLRPSLARQCLQAM